MLIDPGVRQKPDPKGKAIVIGGSVHTEDLLDAGQAGDPSASSSAGGLSPVVCPPENFLSLSDVGTDYLGRSGHPSAVGLFSGEDFGEIQGAVKLLVKVCTG